MSAASRFSYSKNIVLVGSFNPAIFQPAWLAANQLIREDEAEVAEVKVIHPEVTIFDLKWAHVQVTQDRFSVNTEQEPYFEVIRDLAIGVFRLLEHTPVKALGINTSAHYKVQGEEELNKIGDALVPKKVWDKATNSPGVVKLTVQGSRDDDSRGYTQITVEPSAKVKYGVSFNLNDHFNVLDEKSTLGCKEMIDTLEGAWKASEERANHIINTILGAE